MYKISEILQRVDKDDVHGISPFELELTAEPLSRVASTKSVAPVRGVWTKTVSTSVAVSNAVMYKHPE
jgi:hypothetical protein